MPLQMAFMFKGTSRDRRTSIADAFGAELGKPDLPTTQYPSVCVLVQTMDTKFFICYDIF